jgi:hypothetical protein
MISDIINSILSSLFGGTLVYVFLKNDSDFHHIDNEKLKDLCEDYFDADAILIN